VAVLHSRLTGAQRHSIWQDAKHGRARVIIGPRSSVFVPLPRLGIIVVDEEQDSSFKQEEKPHYHAVLVAEQRARRGRAALLLGSATPSLETYDSAQRGETCYYLLRGRPDGAPLPRVEIIDMRGRRGLLSEELITALERCVSGGGQGIVLLNRRGHANFIQCKKCGWVPLCPNCSISLTFHSRGRELLCHYCGHRAPHPKSCPQCGKYRMLHRGAGTQRVEVEITNLVRGARVIRMDLDTTAGKRGHLAVLERFARHEANILLGTQMVAKGHHFPDVTLMGVVAADQGLGYPDFRATERTFRLLFQAAGRTGRGAREGLVLVQTYVPEHYLFEHLAAHDYETFARAELSLRYDLRYPPGGALTLFTISSVQPDATRDGAERVTAALSRLVQGREVDVLGPAPALIERLKRRFRAQVLIKGDVRSDLNREMVEAAQRALASVKGVELQWDIDPVGVS
jgi:primosomal protein N' (replication factor Y)